MAHSKTYQNELNNNMDFEGIDNVLNNALNKERQENVKKYIAELLRLETISKQDKKKWIDFFKDEKNMKEFITFILKKYNIFYGMIQNKVSKNGYITEEYRKKFEKIFYDYLDNVIAPKELNNLNKKLPIELRINSIIKNVSENNFFEKSNKLQTLIFEYLQKNSKLLLNTTNIDFFLIMRKKLLKFNPNNDFEKKILDIFYKLKENKFNFVKFYEIYKKVYPEKNNINTTIEEYIMKKKSHSYDDLIKSIFIDFMRFIHILMTPQINKILNDKNKEIIDKYYYLADIQKQGGGNKKAKHTKKVKYTKKVKKVKYTKKIKNNKN